jgi:hypothetical protein
MEKYTSDERYWIGIRPSGSSPVSVFGPYSLTDARKLQQEWVTTYPASAKISFAFPAIDRVHAESKCRYAMPSEKADRQ